MAKPRGNTQMFLFCAMHGWLKIVRNQELLWVLPAYLNRGAIGLPSMQFFSKAHFYQAAWCGSASADVRAADRVLYEGISSQLDVRLEVIVSSVEQRY